MNLFEQWGLHAPILKAIEDMGFETPSEIQQKAIPTLLEDDTDMVPGELDTEPVELDANEFMMKKIEE